MNEIELKGRKPNIEKLLAFGFKKSDNEFHYHRDILGGEMTLTATIKADGSLYTAVFDNETQDEYVLHRVRDAAGSFVGRVRYEHDEIIEEIADAGFDIQIFKSDQTLQVIDYIRAKYGDELEYLWQKFPDNAIARRKDNRKWYAAVLTVARKKLGFDSEETAEILDLRLKPEQMDSTVDKIKYFPGYHMNKKHWITIILDGSLPLGEIFARIDDSFELAGKK